ncbi:MAG: amidohydrolase [Cyclobacteriaceae bacterium]|nr:amidohydrolase [Cyclobacteriaceae bacterium]
MKYIPFILAFWLLACNAPSQKEETKEEVSSQPRNQADFKKIDFHTHYRYDREYLVPLLKKWNMQTVLIDVPKEDLIQNDTLWAAMKAQYNKHPDQFYLCAGFESSNIDDPEFANKIIAKLEDDFANGARMVKVWKIHGMVTKDASGKYIQIDDPRIQPVWDHLTKRNIPVIAHIGEPLQAWRPLDENNPHYGYYKEHPEYHAYNDPEVPQWEEIMAARDNWIAKNPNLTIVAAHMGSMSHDLKLVAERLDKYPNMYAETAARWGDIVLQDPTLVQDFFIKYQDRVLYGTDFGINSLPDPNNPDNGQGNTIEKRMDMHWQYLSGSDSLLFDRGSLQVKTHSLNLPDSVLRKFYYDNAMGILEQ